MTNIRFRTENSDIVCHCTAAAEILGLYLDQYKVGYTYRLMDRQRFGVRPHARDADKLLFVVAIATLISSIT